MALDTVKLDAAEVDANARLIRATPQLARLDAADTLALSRQLTYFAGERRRLYRPTFWRTIVPKDSSIPAWVDKFEVHKLNDYQNKPVPIGQLGGAKPPKPNVERVSRSFFQYEFVQAYDTFAREALRAAKTGIDLSSARVTACNTANEQMLEQVACIGDSTIYNLGMGGLTTNTDVPIVNTGSGQGFTGGWATATFAQMLFDLQLIAKQVYINTKQNSQANTLALPLAAYYFISEKTNSTTDKSVKELFLETTDSIKRIVPWNPLSTAGAAGVTRAVAFDASDPEVARFVLTQELQEIGTEPVPGGIQTNLSCIFGGVVIEKPKGLVYADGV